MLLDTSLRLISALGEGGMGRVWSAHHELLGRDVAVKVLCTSLCGSADYRARLVREARLTARVDNPNVVRILDCKSPADASPYIVMEKVDGEDLSVRMDRTGVLSIPEAQLVVRQLARALDAVHAAGVVHGDVKAENVIVSEGPEGALRVKLIDFGVARALDEAPLASDMHPSGTPSAMSPEQIVAPDKVSAHWDVWGLAALAFTALTGRSPFDGDSIEVILFATTQGPRVVPSSVRSDLGPGVDALFERAFSRDAAERHASVTEFADALDAALDEENEIVQAPSSERTIIAIGQFRNVRERAETVLPLVRRKAKSTPLAA
jgi:serine/threonine-protein kinase